MRAPTWRGALGGCLGLFLLSLSPVPPAAAATYDVKMTGSMTFSPAAIAVPLGSSIRWINTSTSSNHTATSNWGFFNTGYLTPGKTKTVAFPFAGGFRYYCIPHRHMGMTGNVLVRISAPASDPDRYRVRWATDTASLSYRTFDVHRRAPGATSWSVWALNTKARYFDTWPSKTGTWQYRVRTDNTYYGLTSDWSPIKYVKVS